jgi:cation transport regulator ChaC
VVALYAAYASNLHPGLMAQRAPHSPVRGRGWIHGWRLTFAGEDRSLEGALATIVEDIAQSVFVSVYDLTHLDAQALDTWEGADLSLYRKIHVRVSLEDEEPVTAFAYVMEDYEGGLPSARYVQMIADAALAAGAPEDYIFRLLTRPSRPAL